MTPKTLKGDENMSVNKIKAKEYIYIYTTASEQFRN